jgi:hypothetical protein
MSLHIHTYTHTSVNLDLVVYFSILIIHGIVIVFYYYKCSYQLFASAAFCILVGLKSGPPTHALLLASNTDLFVSAFSCSIRAFD